ncbi:hypothetical protein ACXIUT_15165 [Achromobacter denitrificans]
MTPVSVLFARQDSFYKTLPDVDVYDIDRDARTFQGGTPVIAHPPCRAWGKLFYFAKPRPDEKNLGRLAVALVRECGGVLEHPKDSKLWPAQSIPRPGQAPDMWGGWTLPISQHWWGHRAEKMTWLYIVGCAPADIPVIPLHLGEATHVIAQSRMRRADGTRLRKSSGNPAITGWRPEVTKAEREHTPPELARWLVELARRCSAKLARAA